MTNVCKDTFLTRIGLFFVATGSISLAGPAFASKSSEYSIATNPKGSAYYELSSAMHRVLTEKAGIQLVQKTMGTTDAIPKLATGGVDFAFGNSLDHGLAYVGPERLKVGGRNPYQKSPHLRLVLRGGPNTVGLLVRKDSPIKSLNDIKGKTVAGEYKEQFAIWFNVFALMRSAGIEWEDVKIFPVKNSNDGVKALIEKHVDVAMFSVNGPRVKDADAVVGVRHLSADCSDAGKDRVTKATLGYSLRMLKKGDGFAIVEDTCVLDYDTYLITSQKQSDEAVTGVLKGILTNNEILRKEHQLLKEWSVSRAVDPSVTIPYHPAAVKVFKERNLWTPQMEEAQKALLANAN